jgi:hypothetical protein
MCRRQLATIALMLVTLAPLPALAQYDGVYNGQVLCGPSSQERVPAGTIRVNVAGVTFTYEVQVTGGGVERGAGSVTAPSLSAGGSASGGGVRYDSSYTGQIMPGSLWLSGSQSGTFAAGASGNRQCSISARRGP